ncbi:centrosomal protein CEP57L1 isoform X2 [Protopterus annectens]|uniref:centrosomal protein CEP57L1 isoform X2 n=1 Tax=Protopterus annectens TaxID=7888 RepID=UPI001CF98703|nr:centrosomal protein CEP57L1 isoform X2 [Protopterus annectens]XP_043921205.1 centrosomal protein CEP57L1 isoform X2 [Protopterus annectens]XP_043921214.1 centrosomal protein CEP57L1 isoform X2 [Protopterus annectens]
MNTSFAAKSLIASFCDSPKGMPNSTVSELRKQSSSKTTEVCSRKVSLASSGFPIAPNGQAVITALRTLQDKIRNLELERVHAEENLKRLSSEAVLYKKLFGQENPEQGVLHEEMKQKNEVSKQLTAAEARSALLEKQLEYMKRMVQNAQTETSFDLEKQASLQVDKIQEETKLQMKLGKLEFLEQEYLKLSATQSIAQGKIKQLEQKIVEEQHYRKLIQEKAAQLQTDLEANRILMSSSQSKPKKKNKKKHLTKKMGSGIGMPSEHLTCIKFGGLPFVAGKSTSQSHSVTANIQSVMHTLKHYDTYNYETTGPVSEFKSQGKRICRPVTSHPLSSSSSEGLSGLLLALQDEFGHLSFEHQELAKQIHDTKNDAVREDLERELETLVKQMEIKGNQISMLKKYETNVQKLKQKSPKKKRSASAEPRCDKLKVVKAMPASPRMTQQKSVPGQKSKNSLQLLKNVQKLQMTLKRDDITWEQ